MGKKWVNRVTGNARARCERDSFKKLTLTQTFLGWQKNVLIWNKFNWLLVFNFFHTEKDKQKIVKIFMKIPTALNKTEATKVKLVFSAEFEILSVLRKVLGGEKFMVSFNMCFCFFLTIFYTGQNHSGLWDLCFVISLFSPCLFTIYFSSHCGFMTL